MTGKHLFIKHLLNTFFPVTMLGIALSYGRDK